MASARRNFLFLFFPDDYDFDDPVASTFTVGESVDALSRAVANYYNVNDVVTDEYLHDLICVPGDVPQTLTRRESASLVCPNGTSAVPRPLTLTVTSYTDVNALFNPSAGVFTGSVRTDSYELNSTWLGPLDDSLGPEAQRAFFHSLVDMRLDFPPLRNFAFGPLYRSCVTWGVSVSYDFSARGQVEMTLATDALPSCDEYPGGATAIGDKLLWINVLVILLSSLHAALLLRAVARSFRLVRRLQRWARDTAAGLKADAADAAYAAATVGDVPSRLDYSDASAAGIRLSTFSPGSRGNRNDAESVTASLLPRDAGIAAQTDYEGPRVRLNFRSDLGGVDGGSGDVFVTAESMPRQGAGSRAGATGAILLAPEEGSMGDAARGVADGRRADGGVDIGAAAAGAPLPDAAAVSAAASALHLTWRSLSWRDWLRLINGWTILSLAAAAANIASAALNLNSRNGGVPTDFGHSMAMAIGVALQWLGVVRYVEHDRTYFNLVLTLRRAAPRVLRFLVGVLPVFVAYAFVSVLLWGDRVPRFADPRTAFITLFANLNGDVVRETFMALVTVHPVAAQFFFYTFMSLHTYVVLNIVVAVVEESYFITATKSAALKEALDEATAAEADAGDDDAAHDHGGADAGSEGGGSPTFRGDGGAPTPIARERSRAAMRLQRQLSRAPVNGGGAGDAPFGGAAAPLSLGATAPGSPVPLASSGPVVGASGSPAASMAETLLLDPPAPAKADSDSVKQRPGSKLTALLRLSEWDEVLTGKAVGVRGEQLRREGSQAPGAGQGVREAIRRQASLAPAGGLTAGQYLPRAQPTREASRAPASVAGSEQTDGAR